MASELLRPADPGSGYHRVLARRRFRYIRRDPAHSLRITWIAEPVVCPVCETDTDLQLVLDERTDVFVQVHCPRRHTWSDPAIDPAHFRTYSRLQWDADPDPDRMWIIDEGFGEEPAPPVDLEEVKAVAKTVGRLYKAKAKSRVRGAAGRPVRAAKRKARDAAKQPFTAAARALRGRRKGQEQEQEQLAAQSGRRRVQLGPDGKPMKVPSVAKYRKAYGAPAPKKGPACLVCEDTRTIPGTHISCTECGPA
ncbi:hypothetical protein [Streptomyces sp. MP131-18]|uniref:hypothetical protein n=1 Tax=Streptomyces sp. MP131-18 TaxID=1857892 RepID=UPI0009C66D4F|nr:hypothetical protein [Streptomyces sp. MP131-18]ONK09270.1 hypothetical protein STBA_71250 [Streptomyces sp. MP131-18]